MDCNTNNVDNRATYPVPIKEQRMRIDRRTFISGMLATPLLHPLFQQTERRAPIGLQLYTVRTETAKDLVGTIRRVAEIGYKEIEFGTAQPAKQMKEIMTDVGLSCPSVHMAGTALRTNPDTQIQYAL